ncbi:uncharacterized protein [Palaemon carinicauda]|uniref:uncharacterized protein n=1 Tax=Palaemon carinicauda TaxID=392227 RepID=UPI0035B63F98
MYQKLLISLNHFQNVFISFYQGYLNSQAGYSPHIQHPFQHQQHSGPIFGVPQGYPQYQGLQQNYPQHQGGPPIYPQPQGSPLYPQLQGPPIYPQHQGESQSYPQYPSVQNTYPQHHGPKSYSHFLQKRESDGNVSTGAAPKKPFFDQYYLLDSINTITASLSNYTCVLHKLGLIDEYLNLRVDNYIQQINQKPISQELKKDLADGATYCKDLTYCLPVERLKSPLPLNLQRLLLAMKCEKEARIDACFKEDIRRNIHEFDLSLFPKDDTQESKLNKLSAIVMEADSVDELQVL